MEKDRLVQLLQTILFLSEGIKGKENILKLNLAPHLEDGEKILNFMENL